MERDESMTRKQLLRLCRCILLIVALTVSCFYTDIEGAGKIAARFIGEEATLSGTHILQKSEIVLLRERTLAIEETSALSRGHQENTSCQRRNPFVWGFLLLAVLPELFKQFWSNYRKYQKRNPLRSLLLVRFMLRADGKKAALALHIE